MRAPSLLAGPGRAGSGRKGGHYFHRTKLVSPAQGTWMPWAQADLPVAPVHIVLPHPWADA
ncbi:hypothetical protein J3E64_000378 [Sphingobium sp. OAS761]|uniref:hypothetical protein n=1 Tax=Sphingobium sp. OAS761 TaxID=2817901 RepID=UPI0020A1E24C|nr:hypothetical protein [Sphingobium sp. OAS761]MCP1468711.1 hypothetical protein [Sphingobium sp. OAS761]